jgi:ArsR family transcriptional regulator
VVDEAGLVEASNILAALGQPIRLAIVFALSEGELSAGEVAQCVDAERSNVSRHLGTLVNAGVLVCRREAQQIRYRLKTPCVLNIVRCIDGVRSKPGETAWRCCSTGRRARR